MPDFSFLARDSSGRPQSGTLAADNPSQLAAQLRSRGWIVMEVSNADQQALSIGRMLAMANPVRWLPATRLDVELGMQQLATMLRSGLTLLSSLRTAAEQARRPAMAKVWTLIAERIEEGSYGSCEECGAKIPKARLNAVPYASLCVRCAEQQEQKR